MIIGLAGRKGVGKDTAADYIISHYRFQKLAFADPLKEICRILFLLNDAQLYDPIEKERVDERWGWSPRQMFQKIGTDICRNHIRPDIWIHHMQLRIHPNKNFVISDVRFENERKWIEENGGIVLFIDRFTSSTQNDNHESENLDFFQPLSDIVVYNNDSKESLYKQLDKILSDFNI